jgi:predicted DNA binding protein
MRELVFAVEYDPGADPVMDVFIENGGVRARSVACHVSEEGIWRIDRLTGPADALESIDRIYDGHDRCLDCVTGVHDRRSTEYEVLDADTNSRTVYTFREAGTGCFSVPCLTCKHVRKGVLSESERRGAREEWRLLLRDDSGVGDLYRELESALRPGLSVEFAQLSAPTYWTEKSVSVAELPYEQRAAVEAAVERGYYETPRATSLGDLADDLGVPRSTLQYRLQQAEGWIVRRFVHNSSLGDVALALRERESRTVSA